MESILMPSLAEGEKERDEGAIWQVWKCPSLRCARCPQWLLE